MRSANHGAGPQMNRRRWMRAALPLLSAAVLCGCLPVPVLPTGDTPGSRSNLPGSVPEFMIPGRTTRAQVLLRLGEPDHRGRDDGCFVYFRKSVEGGVAFLYGGAMRGGVIGVPMTFRVLTLHFTREGVLESAGFRVVVQRDFGPYLTPDPPIHGDCPN